MAYFSSLFGVLGKSYEGKTGPYSCFRHSGERLHLLSRMEGVFVSYPFCYFTCHPTSIWIHFLFVLIFLGLPPCSVCFLLIFPSAFSSLLYTFTMRRRCLGETRVFWCSVDLGLGDGDGRKYSTILYMGALGLGFDRDAPLEIWKGLWRWMKGGMRGGRMDGWVLWWEKERGMMDGIFRA